MGKALCVIFLHFRSKMTVQPGNVWRLKKARPSIPLCKNRPLRELHTSPCWVSTRRMIPKCEDRSGSIFNQSLARPREKQNDFPVPVLRHAFSSALSMLRASCLFSAVRARWLWLHSSLGWDWRSWRELCNTHKTSDSVVFRSARGIRSLDLGSRLGVWGNEVRATSSKWPKSVEDATAPYMSLWPVKVTASGRHSELSAWLFKQYSSMNQSTQQRVWGQMSPLPARDFFMGELGS